MKKSLIGLGVVAIAATGVLAACSSDADVASENISKKSDNFEINRRIVFYNGITDKYMLLIEGFCSIDPQDRKITVTCKVGADDYKKHYLGLSDNVTYVVEQLEAANVSSDHYIVNFKPEAILPNVEKR
ncbi:hypothetical protein ABZ319_12230 [Nocardia sp. NPDC005978]|uniref:beta-sandwich lipoprotein n=1 Tax=Nocardia sp. NPDC005978 TaxID=3156725 RepID=UPI0033A6B93B